MITANLQYGPLEAYKLNVILPMMAKRRLVPQGVADVAPLKARVNHGRWLVDCECAGAELAFEEGLFICLSCFNLEHGHKYRPVIFPKHRKAIELALMSRPVVNRNWEPGESLAFLKADNERHGGGC
ncbi:hypothetical protein LCGC14_0970790 [marine sediment metagenome]|uniref:Uncharacterized protein n=1 Tax=marine sediment metagenome TaxID=412755 RepID=A0A0F9NXZ1_9ZZZZ